MNGDLPANVPASYFVQSQLQCCATCKFVAELSGDWDVIYACEILGKTPGSDYSLTTVNPLGICTAYQRELDQ